MRRIMSVVFVVSLIVYLSGTRTSAQGKGQGRAPGGEVGQTRTPKTTADEHGDHAKDQTAAHEAKDAAKDQAFESRIESNPQLKSRVESLLPSGTTLQTAAMGFRNQGQFLAALHVSKNLNIPFDQLKAKVTGDHPVSLGKAIEELRPNLTAKDAKTEVEKAEKQAKQTEKTGTKPTT